MSNNHAPPTLTPAEVAALLTELTPGNAYGYARRTAIRNRAIALLMLDGGCRADELCHLQYDDAYFDGQPRETLDIRDAISKYHQGRRVPMPPRLKEALTQLHAEYHPAGPNCTPRFLVYIKFPQQPMSRRQIHRVISEAAARALRRQVYPHMLRHTFIDELRQVTDTANVQKLCGHVRLSSTQHYCHPTHEQKVAAVAARTAKFQEPQP